MAQVLKLVVVLVFGVILGGVLIEGYVHDTQKDLLTKLDRQQQAEVDQLDQLVNEFLAIEPRSEWPPLMVEVTDIRLAAKFAEGAREAGVRLTPHQLEMVRTIIIPRIKEKMAETVERINPADEASTKRTIVEMEERTNAFVEKYRAAMYVLLMKARRLDATVL